MAAVAGVGRKLRILVLAEELSYPPNSGKRIRTWNLLRQLAKRHSISCLCFGRDDDPALKEYEAAGIRAHLVPPQPEWRGWSLYIRLFRNLFSRFPYSITKHYSRLFEDKLKDLLDEQHFDLVHSEGTLCASYLTAIKHVPRVLGTHNIESQIWFRRAGQAGTWMERVFFRLQAIKMRRFERRALLQVESAIAVTPQDAEQMRDWGVRAVTVVPNGVDWEAYQISGEPERSCELLFLASLDWFPNADALDYFLAEIFPLILAVRPDAQLRIVGRRPPEAMRKLVAGHSNAELVGEVPDVRPYLARAAVVVVPLRIGGGSRLKILEALAAGKAVISTSVGAEGLGLVSNEHFLAADTPSDFARSVVTLMSDEGERARLGENGRKLVKEQYGWDRIAASLESAWFDVLATQA